MLFEGIFPALTTPFYADGRLYARKLEQNVAQYSRTACAGMVALGSTGEAVMLSADEQIEVLKTVADSADADKVLIAGVGHESVRETLALAEHAARLDYDAVLVRTPFYYRAQMTDAAMLSYFRMVADAAELPVLLYSVPAFTNYELPVELIAQLAHHANIIGIKDSSGKPDRIAAIVAATANVRRTVNVTPTFTAITHRMERESTSGANFVAIESLASANPDIPGITTAVAPPVLKQRTREVSFQVLSGSAATLEPSLSNGASGAVLAFACCAPQNCYEVYAAFKERNAPLAALKQERIRAVAIRVGVELGVAGIKYACELNGYYGGNPRAPLLPLTAAQKDEVALLMADNRQ
jgi:dihydrodipicolinate synthase/N-acetylneuraminate lyase